MQVMYIHVFETEFVFLVSVFLFETKKAELRNGNCIAYSTIFFLIFI